MTRAVILASLTWHYALHYAALGVEYPALLVLALAAAWVLLLALRSAALWMCRLRARRAEKTARRLLRVPRTHPESITAVLPDAEESYLAELASELWPCDEFAEISREFGDFQ